MKIDCVVTETLSCLVTLPAAAFEGFADSYLCSVAVLGMVLNTIYILISLFTPRNWTGKWLFIPSIHTHGAQDCFGANGTLCGPGFIAI